MITLTDAEYDGLKQRAEAAEWERDALKKFAEFCDYHHRRCKGLLGQHLDCDCGYSEARDKLRAALRPAEPPAKHYQHPHDCLGDCCVRLIAGKLYYGDGVTRVPDCDWLYDKEQAEVDHSKGGGT